MAERPIRLLYEGALLSGVRTAIESLGWGDRLGWRAPAGTQSFVRRVKFRGIDLVVDRSQRTAIVTGTLDPSLGGAKLGDTPYRRARTETMRELSGIVFTVDSQTPRMPANHERLAHVLSDLRYVGRDPARVPLIFQLNKRDLPRIEDLEALREQLVWEGPVDHVPTIATQGRGLGETVAKLLAMLVVLACAGCGSRTGLSDASPQLDASPRLDAATRPDAASAASDAGVREAICPLGAENAWVGGNTPLGPIEARFAWAGEIEACSSFVVLGEEDGLHGSTPSPREPSLTLRGLTESEVTVTVRAGGEHSEAIGRLVVRELVPPNDDPRGGGEGLCACLRVPGDPDPPCMPGAAHGHIAADLVVDAPGWSLGGSLRAPHCHALHAICI